MKKILALLLALIMCVSIFAACGEEKKPTTNEPDTTDPGTTEDPGTSEEPGTTEDPGTSEEPGTSEDIVVNPNATIAYFDKAEDWTLVIAKPGTSGDERVGVLAEPGKIVAGTYNTAGNQRKTTEYVFDFASLGLEGKSWEYLGARVELDLSDENNPKILNKIEKTCFCVQYTDLTFPTDTSVKLPNGVEFDLTNINYGMIRTNNLLNEGGWYIPKWNDKTTVTSKESKLFTHEDFVMNYYIFIKCTYVSSRGNTICDMILDSKVDLNAAATPDEPTTPDTPVTPDEPTTPDNPTPHTHAYDAGKVTKEATCKEEGTKTYTCACGETKTEKIAKSNAHTFKDGVCSVCGAKDPNYVAPVADNAYIVVANEWYTIATDYSTELVTEGNSYYKAWQEGMTTTKYFTTSMLALEGTMFAVKADKLDVYAKGEIEDEDLVIIEESDSEGKYVGTEILVDFNKDGSVKSFKPSGRSVVGKLTITKSGEKFTLKVADKTYLSNVDKSAKMATKVYDTTTANAWYVSKKAGKISYIDAKEVNLDMQLAYGNDTRDVTTIGLFYDEFYNINYEGEFDGYDWDGDGKLDLIVCNRPVASYIKSDATDTSVAFGIFSDNFNHSNVKTSQTGTPIALDGTNTAPAGLKKGDYVMVYEDYRTNKYTVITPVIVKGKLESIDLTAGKVAVAGKTYTILVQGEMHYTISKPISNFSRDTEQSQWNASVGKDVTLYIDKLGNVVAAVLPA